MPASVPDLEEQKRKLLLSSEDLVNGFTEPTKTGYVYNDFELQHVLHFTQASSFLSLNDSLKVNFPLCMFIK